MSVLLGGIPLLSRLLLLLLLVVLAPAAFGQTHPVQPCRADELEPSLQIADEPGGVYTITINFRNTSVEPCFMGPPYAGGTRLTLLPGESLHQNIKSSSPAHDAGWGFAPVIIPCTHRTEISVQVNESSSTFTLVSPSLLKPLCSRFTVRDHGDYLPGAVGAGVIAGTTPQPGIEWQNDPEDHFTRERIPLRLVINDFAHQLVRDENSCPRLLVQVRNLRTADRPPSVRVQEIQSVTCEIGGKAARTQVVEEFDAANASKWVDGEYALQASGWVTLDGHYNFVNTADVLRLSVVGGKFIHRKWGRQLHGLGVDLTLDKDAYALGEDIPLHIAMANFSSPVRIFAQLPLWDPPAIAVEVRDAKGNPVPVSGQDIWVGHGFCGTYARGAIVQDELKLSQMRLLPREPGVYSVVAVWQPTPNPDWNCLDSPPSSAYRIESAPAVFTVLRPDGK